MNHMSTSPTTPTSTRRCATCWRPSRVDAKLRPHGVLKHRTDSAARRGPRRARPGAPAVRPRLLAASQDADQARSPTEFFDAIGAAGYFGTFIPEAYGGLEAGRSRRGGPRRGGQPSREATPPRSTRRWRSAAPSCSQRHRGAEADATLPRRREPATSVSSPWRRPSPTAAPTWPSSRVDRAARRRPLGAQRKQGADLVCRAHALCMILLAQRRRGDHALPPRPRRGERPSGDASHRHGCSPHDLEPIHRRAARA